MSTEGVKPLAHVLLHNICITSDSDGSCTDPSFRAEVLSMLSTERLRLLVCSRVCLVFPFIGGCPGLSSTSPDLCSSVAIRNTRAKERRRLYSFTVLTLAQSVHQHTFIHKVHKNSDKASTYHPESQRAHRHGYLLHTGTQIYTINVLGGE